MAARRAPVPMFYFTAIKNIGDQINPWLVSNLFDIEVRLSTQERAHVLGIGSLMGMANRSSRIWGTGVLHPTVIGPDIVADNVYAVRGKLSYAAMRTIGIRMRDIPLGDPGFLVGRIAANWPRPAKKYRLGIAAHYVDRGNPLVRSLLGRSDVADLDVHKNPDEFLKTLLTCEAIASSSLHGLVFAEALEVPNVWIELSDKVLGDRFKFRDWFSLADDPQQQPEVPASPDALLGLALKAGLHNVRIDADALIKNFPVLELES